MSVNYDFYGKLFEAALQCPSCEQVPSTEHEILWQPYYSKSLFLARCTHCDAIFGVVDEYIVSQFVRLGVWADEQELAAAESRYFDFLVTRPVKGSFRCHGWYDKRTGKIIQEG